MFDRTSLAIRTSDGRNFTTLEPLTFTDQDGQSYTVPAGSTGDGASVPRALWPSLPPFGPYWMASVLHDYLYRCTDLPKHRCDQLLYNAMMASGVSREQAGLIFQGVHLAGASSFRADRALTTPPDA